MPELNQAEYRRMKGRLTRLENQLRKTGLTGMVANDADDPRVPILHAIIAEAKYAQEQFSHIGWPDDWSRWPRAEDDARFTLGSAFVGVPW